MLKVNNIERLDELIQSLDFGLVQEGYDLGRKGACGYHYTSDYGLQEIRRTGLGDRPELVGDHEVEYWLALPFLPLRTAARLFVRWADNPGRYGNLSAEQLSVQVALERALKRVKSLRVVWFYREQLGGYTAQHADKCVVFDLQAVGDWLGENAEAYTFGDQADGYAVAWVGPPIPPSLLAECEEG